MKIYEIYHVTEKKHEKTDKETGEIKSVSSWTRIGTGFKKDNKESITLKIDFYPNAENKGLITLIPKK
tara:strand:+ start:623 stop:826 length:204 start_codon:yes stop_codon:yes gene_type:complete